MSSLTETCRGGAGLLLALAAGYLGCSADGDQMLGKILSGDLTIPGDGGPPRVDGGRCTPKAYPGLKAEPNLYFIVDRSQAMAGPMMDRWDAFSSAFIGYLRSAPADAPRIGLAYYPIFNRSCSHCGTSCDCLAMCGCPCRSNEPQWCPRSSLSCDDDDYAKPDIDIGPLPENATGLAASLGQQWAGGPSTVCAALRGSRKHTARWENNHPGQRIVQVLVAGGPPSESCSPSSASDCAEIASDSSSRTYVVAFGADGGPLSSIASRGGTGAPIEFDPGGDLIGRFSEIVRQIRGAEMRCEYTIDTSDPSFDYGKVNVRITGLSTVPIPMKQVRNRDACDGSDHEWYYEGADRDHPSRIVVCDVTCNDVRKNPGVAVEILLGCPTDPVTPPPP